MEFQELLGYARQYKKEMETLDGLREFLERIKDFDKYDIQAFDILTNDLNINESSEKIKDGDYRYYDDIYEYVDDYFSNSGTHDIPYWVSIDYDITFRNICCESQIAYTDKDSPFVEYY